MCPSLISGNIPSVASSSVIVSKHTTFNMGENLKHILGRVGNRMRTRLLHIIEDRTSLGDLRMIARKIKDEVTNQLKNEDDLNDDEPKDSKEIDNNQVTRKTAPKTEILKSEDNIKEIIVRNKNKDDLSDDDSEDNNDIDNNQGTRKTAPRTEILKHRNNIKEIILNSNATPIRKYEGIGYSCCYCRQQYSKPAELKKHTLDTHKDVDNANFMTNMNMSEYVVKLDVTDLKCNICDTLMSSLDEFINHLTVVHNKTMHEDIKSHIFPMKFDNEVNQVISCVFCPNTFSKFRMLVQHMHKHFRNFVCEICDAGFVNRNSWTQHIVNHKTGEYKCDFCPKVFTTQVKKRHHERASHTHVDELNKCAYCDETFKCYRKREAHLAEVHGIESNEVVCQACNKVFKTQRLLNTHVKRDHLLERPHKCTECEKSFYSSTHLKNHMVTHSKSREFQCKVCLKSYGRKKTLNAHMRVHEEKKFKCELCSSSYTQNQTLRSHLKFKHGVE